MANSDQYLRVGSDEWFAVLERGSAEIKERDARIDRCKDQPTTATPDDVVFLAERVKNLEQYLSDLYAAGALRPRHEWHIWHDNIKEQLRLNREAFRGNQTTDQNTET